MISTTSLKPSHPKCNSCIVRQKCVQCQEERGGRVSAERRTEPHKLHGAEQTAAGKLKRQARGGETSRVKYFLTSKPLYCSQMDDSFNDNTMKTGEGSEHTVILLRHGESQWNSDNRCSLLWTSFLLAYVLHLGPWQGHQWSPHKV